MPSWCLGGVHSERFGLIAMQSRSMTGRAIQATIARSGLHQRCGQALQLLSKSGGLLWTLQAPEFPRLWGSTAAPADRVCPCFLVSRNSVHLIIIMPPECPTVFISTSHFHFTRDAVAPRAPCVHPLQIQAPSTFLDNRVTAYVG